jgi:hypothetical protein
LKRGPVLPTVALAEVPTPAPVAGHFLPLNRAPITPQGQTIPSRGLSPTTVETLRAKNKFAPGAVNQSNAAALAAAQRRVLNPSAPPQEPAASAPQSPQWVDEAMRNLDKYAAMKGRPKTP